MKETEARIKDLAARMAAKSDLNADAIIGIIRECSNREVKESEMRLSEMEKKLRMLNEQAESYISEVRETFKNLTKANSKSIRENLYKWGDVETEAEQLAKSISELRANRENVYLFLDEDVDDVQETKTEKKSYRKYGYHGKMQYPIYAMKDGKVAFVINCNKDFKAHGIHSGAMYYAINQPGYTVYGYSYTTEMPESMKQEEKPVKKTAHVRKQKKSVKKGSILPVWVKTKDSNSIVCVSTAAQAKAYGIHVGTIWNYRNTELGKKGQPIKMHNGNVVYLNKKDAGDDVKVIRSGRIPKMMKVYKITDGAEFCGAYTVQDAAKKFGMPTASIYGVLSNHLNSYKGFTFSYRKLSEKELKERMSKMNKSK